MSAAMGDKMFPDGREHNFGDVAYGETVKHVFRVVNTRGSSFELSSVRASCGCLTASASPAVLAPGEEGKVEIAVDTSRFLGTKNITLYLTVTRAGGAEEYRFTVSANSQVDLRPTPNR
jgi:hypothetical protein